MKKITIFLLVMFPVFITIFGNEGSPLVSPKKEHDKPRRENSRPIDIKPSKKGETPYQPWPGGASPTEDPNSMHSGSTSIASGCSSYQDYVDYP